MCSVDAENGMTVTDSEFIAARTRRKNGQMIIDELVGRSNVILTAKRAGWDDRLISILEDDLLAVMAEYHRVCRRLEDGRP